MKGLPGVIKPLAGYRGWNKGGNQKRSIEEKREAVVRGIERSLRGVKGSPKLEVFDPLQKLPVIRVLYASHPLPIFEGENFAVIQPDCDRAALWGAVIEQIREGRFDREIEAVASKVSRSLERKRQARNAA